MRLRISLALTGGERHLLLNALTPRTVPAGHTILKQGDVNDTFYVLRSGTVDVTHDAENGAPQPTHVQTLHGGEPTAYFGESAAPQHGLTQRRALLPPHDICALFSLHACTRLACTRTRLLSTA